MKTALIIAHGSKENSNGDAAELHAQRMEAMLGTRVRHLYKNCSDEEMAEALSFLARGNTDEIVVIPLFFASSVFSESMVPKKVGLGEGERFGSIDVDGRKVRIRIAKPFGTDPHIRGVIGTILSRNEANPERTAVMLIGHGSKDGANQDAVEFNAGIVREFGYDAYPCYNEMCQPTVEQTLIDLLNKGYDDILAIPMFVSSSNHSVVEIPEKLGLPEGTRERELEMGGRTVTIRYATEIGLEPGVADILCKMVRD